ncbi:MAG: DUF1501 domain-containing protein [Planctomycetaceae bacterium]
MLRILGHSSSIRGFLHRRDALRVGALSLLGEASLSHLLRSRARAESIGKPSQGPAQSVILLNLFGGPPHMDMFDLKPAAPSNVRGEFQPISTAVSGLQICEKLPRIAQLMDRATLIRTYSHRYNSHNPYNVLTGFDGGNDRENYFSKRTDHPSMGSVCEYLDIGRTDVPRYVLMPAFPGYTQALRRAGPYGGYLGSGFNPLFTVCEPTFARKSKDDYDPVPAMGVPVLPSLESLPDITLDRLDRRQSLLQQFDQRMGELDASGQTQTMSHFQQRVFELLTSARTRGAFDISRESPETREAFGSSLWGSSLLIARRLVEAGSTFVTVNWEAKNGSHWDLHGNNFGMLRSHLPQLDQMTSALILDLEQRNLLDSTLVVVMGEMGRTPRVNAKSGRDHWPQCGFALLFGGGTQPGCVLGKTDKQAAYPIDRPVSAGDMVATIYHLLGVDSAMTVPDLSGRPIPIAHGGEPVWEIIG